MTPTCILLIEGQFFSRLALRAVIEQCDDMSVVAEAETGASGLELFEQHNPDVCITELRLPDMSGFELIKAMRAKNPEVRVVVVSNSEGADHVTRAIDAGAMAYLTKSSKPESLIEAIRSVREGQQYIPESLVRLMEESAIGRELTPRERDVLETLTHGQTNKQIGDRLGISEKTVRAHMSNVLTKLGAADRTQAVLIAIQRGFVDLPVSVL